MNELHVMEIIGKCRWTTPDYGKCNLNPYRFLMTLVHEVAHLVAFQKYGRAIKPHGKEWKFTFQTLMLPFIRPGSLSKCVVTATSTSF